MRKQNTGFTLVELMIVVAIIGVLAAILLPMAGDVIAKAEEGSTKANLGILRTAFGVYVTDYNGNFPADLSVLTTNGTYLQAIPTAYYPRTSLSPGHPPSNQVSVNAFINGAYPSHATVVGNLDTGFGLGGGWSYNTSDIGQADITPFCGHKDLKGSIWATN